MFDKWIFVAIKILGYVQPENKLIFQNHAYLVTSLFEISSTFQVALNHPTYSHAYIKFDSEMLTVLL